MVIGRNFRFLVNEVGELVSPRLFTAYIGTNNIALCERFFKIIDIVLDRLVIVVVIICLEVIVDEGENVERSINGALLVFKLIHLSLNGIVMLKNLVCGHDVYAVRIFLKEVNSHEGVELCLIRSGICLIEVRHEIVFHPLLCFGIGVAGVRLDIMIPDCCSSFLCIIRKRCGILARRYNSVVECCKSLTAGSGIGRICKRNELLCRHVREVHCEPLFEVVTGVNDGVAEHIDITVFAGDTGGRALIINLAAGDTVIIGNGKGCVMIGAVDVLLHRLGSFPRKDVIAALDNEPTGARIAVIVAKNSLVVSERDAACTGATGRLGHEVVIQVLVCTPRCNSILIPCAGNIIPAAGIGIHLNSPVVGTGAAARNTLFVFRADSLLNAIVILVDGINHVRSSGSRKDGEADGNARHDHEDREDATQKFFSKFHKVFPP